ncbi:MAG: hypothetical protein HOV80_12475, partial [Polyangiaceae bacterium]|nr:hypothetical protein [Polyangiaceae bacterium]
MRRSWVGLLALVLVACDESAPPEEEPKPLPTDVPQGLDAREILVRASLDVRGIRPTEDELARIEADEGELEAILDEMVLDPRLGDSVGTIFAEAMRVRGPLRYELSFPGVGESDFAEQAVNLVRYVATTDRPFSEILTSDVAIVAPGMIDEWPGDRDPLRRVEPQPADLPPGTAMARYTDGRPA